MAWNSDDLSKLEKAIASGARVVKYATGEVEYRSLTEMNKIRNQIRKALGLGNPAKKITPRTSKGL